jgi:hypothetical protein
MPTTIDGSGNINTTSGKISTTGKFISPNGPIQRVYQQAQSAASHISTNTTSEQILGVTATITPILASSKILVHWYSMMIYGAASSWLAAALYRSLDGGTTYTAIVPIQGGYPPGPYYGWGYWESSWQPSNLYYFDTPNTTSAVIYQLRYRTMNSNGGTNYLVHQGGQYYGWILTEIAQ